MASKTLVALGVLLAAFLLVSTNVAARDLEEQQYEEEVNGVNIADQGHGGYNGPNVVDGENGNDHHDGNRRCPSHCRHGCCRCIGRRCVRCCRTADEIPDAGHVTPIGNLRTDEEEVDGVDVADQGQGVYNGLSVVDGENGNDHHDGNRRCPSSCRHGCCRCIGHRCIRCCRTADEILDADHVTSIGNLHTDEEEVDSVDVADQGHGGYNGPSVVDGENGNDHHDNNRRCFSKRCPYRCCRCIGRRCVRCCRTADEIPEVEYMHIMSIV